MHRCAPNAKGRPKAAQRCTAQLSPHPDWVRSLPYAKLPDRNDFVHYAHDPTQRMRLWRTAVSASEQLAQEFSTWVQRPDVAVVGAL